MKRLTQSGSARASIAGLLSSEYERARCTVRDYDDGKYRTYRRERKRFLLVALKAVLRAK